MGKKGAQQGGEPRFLTEEEIWDDSALLQTWDDAVQEYERYHSIHARGEDIEEVLKRAEEGVLKEGHGNDHEAADASASVQPDKQGEDEVMAGAEEPVESHDPVAAQEQQPRFEQRQAKNDVEKPLPANGMAHPLPLQVPAGMDEGMKNLMMSWYYAGYYTGLYEGQQRASSNKQDGQSNGEK
ncbi:hypothetical protein KEM55_002315 [Ascosphaera atra]|nr:hypothetical protein KEM55_002315 [Ascosphaera atra]